MPNFYGEDAASLASEAADVKRSQEERQSSFDVDGAAALNAGLPLSLLAEAASSDVLPPRLRRDRAIGSSTHVPLRGERRPRSRAPFAPEAPSSPLTFASAGCGS